MYIDGFLVPVPEGKKQAYHDMAAKVWPMFKEFGVLQQVECWGSDLPKGKVTDFFMAVKAEAGENVVFSWMVWPDKESRDKGWAKMMQDDRMKPEGEMPFDGMRMFWGGFDVLFDSKDA